MKTITARKQETSMKLKKIISVFILFSLVSVACSGNAMENQTEDQDPGMLPELIMRPAGFCGSIIGLTAFILSTPFAGLASIPEPHDAFQKTYNAFLETPFRYTFTRPLGDYSLTIDAD